MHIRFLTECPPNYFSITYLKHNYLSKEIYLAAAGSLFREPSDFLFILKIFANEYYLVAVLPSGDSIYFVYKMPRKRKTVSTIYSPLC